MIFQKKYKKFRSVVVFLGILFWALSGICEESSKSDLQKKQSKKVNVQIDTGKRSSGKKRNQSDIEVLANTTVTVLPEVTTKVFLSNKQINRFTCMGNRPVKDVLFSSEMGITKQISGNDAYIKFLVQKYPNEQGFRYNTEPAEFYVICGSENTNYTIIGVPQSIPAQHIQLSGEKSVNIEKNQSLFTGMSFEKKVLSIIKQGYLGEYPDSYDVKQMNKPLISLKKKGFRGFLRTIANIDGEGLRLKIVHITVSDQSRQDKYSVNEKDFIMSELTQAPVGIALDRKVIQKGVTTRLFILEQVKRG